MKGSHKTGILLAILCLIILSFTCSPFYTRWIHHFLYFKEMDNSSNSLHIKAATESLKTLGTPNGTRWKSGSHQREIKQLKCRVLPDILIIGFEKCGTGTLRRFLGKHPGVWMVERSGMDTFFSPDNHKSLKEFAKGRPCIPKGKLLIEKLAVNGLPEKVLEYIPDVKLIAIVKEPSERVLSVFLHRKATGWLPPGIRDFETYAEKVCKCKKQRDLDKMMALDPTRGLNGSSIYYNRLKTWIDVFGRDNILVLDGDDFAINPARQLRLAESFIGLENILDESRFYYNKERGFYCMKLKGGDDGCMQKGKGRPHPVMLNSTRIFQAPQSTTL